MRTFNRIMLVLMTCSLVTLTNCSNDDDNSGGSGAASGVLEAQVDGASFESLEISSSATIVNAGGVTNFIVIASNSDGNAFAFTIVGYDGPGTYPLGGGANITNSASYSETDVSDPMNPTTEIWQAPYDANEVGSITVTEESDDNIKGNFEFTCKNVNGDNSVKTITDGSFNLNKQTS